MKTLQTKFLEKVYANALFLELIERGCFCEKQQMIKVYYKGCQVGEYFADEVVDRKVIIEIKAAEDIVEEHENQLQNYLKATEMEVGLLLNFGKKPQFQKKNFCQRQKSIVEVDPSQFSNQL